MVHRIFADVVIIILSSNVTKETTILTKNRAKLRSKKCRSFVSLYRCSFSFRRNNGPSNFREHRKSLYLIATSCISHVCLLLTIPIKRTRNGGLLRATFLCFSNLKLKRFARSEEVRSQRCPGMSATLSYSDRPLIGRVAGRITTRVVFK